MWYLTKQPPSSYWGPIKIEQLPGKGRGIVATRDLEPGDLLMSCPPLVMITCPEGEDLPEPDDLVEHMLQRSYTEAELKQLMDLYDGSDLFLEPLPDWNIQIASDGQQAASECSTSGREEGEQGRLIQGSSLDIDRVYRVVVLNSFGEEAADLPASICRGDKMLGLLGLWPQFSLLNHSCFANAVNMVVKDHMIVRAVRHVAAGEEVAINYLGRGGLLAMGERQLQLEEGYGFTCGCARCQAESEELSGGWLGGWVGCGQPSGHRAVAGSVGVNTVWWADRECGAGADLSQAASIVWRTVERDLRPDLEVAFATGDKGLQEEMIREMRRLVGALSKNAIAAGCSSQERVFVEAGAYECYSTLANAAELMEEWREGPSRKCLDIIEEVAPGSDLHVLLAVRHLTNVQRKHNAAGKEAEAALEVCVEACRRRYGRLDRRVLEKLVVSGSLAVERVVL